MVDATLSGSKALALFPGGVATGYEILPFQGKDQQHQTGVDTNGSRSRTAPLRNQLTYQFAVVNCRAFVAAVVSEGGAQVIQSQ